MKRNMMKQAQEGEQIADQRHQLGLSADDVRQMMELYEAAPTPINGCMDIISKSYMAGLAVGMRAAERDKDDEWGNNTKLMFWKLLIDYYENCINHYEFVLNDLNRPSDVPAIEISRVGMVENLQMCVAKFRMELDDANEEYERIERKLK